MRELLHIIGIAICGVVMQQLLTEFGRKEAALMVSICCAVVILGRVMQPLSQAMHNIRAIAAQNELHDSNIGVLIKVTGISLLAEMGAQLCRDAGSGALAQKIELAGKGMILCAVVPVISELFSAALQLLQ